MEWFMLSATCTTSETSGTNCKVAVSLQESMGMLRKFALRVVHIYKLQI